MKLDRVTFTGADDSIDPAALIPISEAYPWVEWGILMASEGIGWAHGDRFPSLRWVEDLLKVTKDKSAMNFCAHLCGYWVTDITFGGKYDFGKLPFSNRFARVQLNFHAQPQNFDAIIGLRNAKRQFIFQVDGRNDNLIQSWVEKGLGTPLFDISGGAGVLPEEGWPKFWTSSPYCGYAGGLGPDSVTEQVPLIAEAAGDGRIWIDMETRVRSKSDKSFDLKKVVDVCEKVKAFVAS